MLSVLCLYIPEGGVEKEMATQSNILAWRIPWTEEPGRLQSTGLQDSDMTERLTHTHKGRSGGEGRVWASAGP